jgi:hypothetical protein
MTFKTIYFILYVVLFLIYKPQRFENLSSLDGGY